jgi:ketosteroid isomerase-like protein
MSSETHTESARTGEPVIGLSTGTLFLELLARRDFPGMARCLAPDVRLRALLPPRDVDVTGPDAVLAEFRRWFGNDAEALEMVDATVGEVGPRLYLRWRIRLSSEDGAGASRVVEQHAYATVGDQIESLNLLCSGFVAD